MNESTAGDPMYECQICHSWVYLHGFHACNPNPVTIVLPQMDASQYRFSVGSVGWNESRQRLVRAIRELGEFKRWAQVQLKIDNDWAREVQRKLRKLEEHD